MCGACSQESKKETTSRAQKLASSQHDRLRSQVCASTKKSFCFISNRLSCRQRWQHGLRRRQYACLPLLLVCFESRIQAWSAPQVRRLLQGHSIRLSDTFRIFDANKSGKHLLHLDFVLKVESHVVVPCILHLAHPWERGAAETDCLSKFVD